MKQNLCRKYKKRGKMKKILGKFEVDYLQVLDENGNYDKKLIPKIGNDRIKKMYELMIFTRILRLVIVFFVLKFHEWRVF